jgi:hypothetical protein
MSPSEIQSYTEEKNARRRAKRSNVKETDGALASELALKGQLCCRPGDMEVVTSCSN